MPGTTTTRDPERIVTDFGGGGGGVKPPWRGGGGGDEDKGGRRWKPPQGRYPTAISLVLASVTMFFLVPCTVFVVLRRTSDAWVSLHVPKILWLNTAILLVSSFTLEKARRRLLAAKDFAGFRKLWRATTILGILFLAGQFVAWLQLAASGLYIASTQAASFFYIFTAAHAVHLLGGIAGLLYVAISDFEKGQISRFTAVRITSYYWHFMDGLWVCLLLLLYLGR